MSVTQEIMSQLTGAKVWPSRVTLSERKYFELLRELPLRLLPAHWDGTMYWCGLEIAMAAPTGYCRNCGAPTEPESCSYCRSPSDWIEVK